MRSFFEETRANDVGPNALVCGDRHSAAGSGAACDAHGSAPCGSQPPLRRLTLHQGRPRAPLCLALCWVHMTHMAVSGLHVLSAPSSCRGRRGCRRGVVFRRQDLHLLSQRPRHPRERHQQWGGRGGRALRPPRPGPGARAALVHTITLEARGVRDASWFQQVNACGNVSPLSPRPRPGPAVWSFAKLRRAHWTQRRQAQIWPVQPSPGVGERLKAGGGTVGACLGTRVTAMWHAVVGAARPVSGRGCAAKRAATGLFQECGSHGAKREAAGWFRSGRSPGQMP